MLILLAAILVVGLAGICSPAQAAEGAEVIARGTCGEDITWTMDADGTLIISGTGPIPDFDQTSDMPWLRFRNETTHVVIDEGITAIGDYAFSDMVQIRKMEIAEGVTSIGYYAIESCVRMTEITLPATLEHLDHGAFSSCKALKAIDLPEGLVSIGPSAFDRCVKLTEIDIPDNVTSIGKNAFSRCTALERVKLPKKSTQIAQYMFYGCSKLAQVEIPEGVTDIGSQAFQGCALTTIGLPESLTGIGYGAFNRCFDLTALTIPDGVRSIGPQAFMYCEGLTELQLPARLEAIGSEAFSYCTGLSSVWGGDDATEIGESAFYGCYSLTSIQLPEKLEKIGRFAFGRCTGSTEIMFPACVKEIAFNVFTECEALQKVEISADNPYIRADDRGVVFSKDGKKLLRLLLPLTGSYQIPEGVTTICEKALYQGGEDRLVELTLPDSLKRIEAYGLWDCAGLKQLVIPENVTYIGQYAFSGCDALDELVFRGSKPTMEHDEYFRSNLSLMDVDSLYYPNGYDWGKFRWTIELYNVYCVNYGTAYDKPAIKTQPQDADGLMGQKATVTVKATGEDLQYTWYYANAGSDRFRKTKAFKGPEYAVELDDARVGRRVYCVVTDRFGNSVTSRTVTLRLGTPVKIISQPSSVSAYAGKTAKVTVTAQGKGLEYTWYYVNKGNDSFTKTDSFKGDTYSLTTTAARNGRRVYCVITDKYGKKVKSEVVTLSME